MYDNLCCGQAAKQSLAEESGKRSVLQEQVTALNIRLEEANANASQQEPVPNNAAAKVGNFSVKTRISAKSSLSYVQSR